LRDYRSLKMSDVDDEFMEFLGGAREDERTVTSMAS
jgi:hypothetical protein